MAKTPNKPLPADTDTAVEVPATTGPAPKSVETLDNGAIVETF